jgi:hypothetical protein
MQPSRNHRLRLFFPFVALALVAAALVAGTVSAGAAPAHSASVTPKPGRYSGSAGLFTLSFTVSAGGKQIAHLTTDYNPAADCSVPTSIQSEAFPTLAVRRGSFTGSTTLGSSGSAQFFSIRGSFSTPTKAAGTIHGHFSIPHNALPPCSNTTAFTVQRVGK